MKMKATNISNILLPLLLITLITLIESRTLPSPQTTQNPELEQEEKEYLDKIQTSCNRTAHYDLCVSILVPDHRTRGTDLKGFAWIVMQRELSVAMDLLSTAQSVTYASHIDEKLRAKCRECVKLLKSIVFEQFPKAYRSVAYGKYDDAIEALTRVGKNSMTCSDEGDATCAIVGPSVHDMSHVVIGLLEAI